MNIGALLSHGPWQRFHGIGPLALAQIVTIGCGLLTTVAWTRLMPQETFGEFRIVLAVLSFAGCFCLLGVGQAAIMSASRGKDGNFTSLVRAKVIANIVGAVIVAGAAGYYGWSDTGSPTLVVALAIAALIFPVHNLSDIWISWLNGKSRFALLSIGRVTLAAAPLIAVLVAARLFDGSLWAVVVVVFGATSALNLTLLLMSNKGLGNKDTDVSLEKFGNHNSIAYLISSLASLDVLVLNDFYSAAEVAVYSIVLQFPEAAKLGLGLFSQVLSPRIYGMQSVRSAWNDIKRPFWLVTAAFCVVGVAGFFAMEMLIGVFFSEKYVSAAPYSKWLWLVVCASGSTSLLGTVLLGTKRPIFVYIPAVGYPLVLAALYVLMGQAGVAGLISARIIATIALGVFYVAGFFLHLRWLGPESAGS